ncbi:alpha-amylase family glycosyl hydrolase [Roseateles microcysteis]|uniref:alpha-amylase family glycosyl hydrolase n=1 Tax=Roseateles microcysteis TaxID=3119057 RepID=UPI002FE63AA6
MSKFLLMLATMLVASATLPVRPAMAAAKCQASPLGQRELFLRGSFNGWSAEDAQRFSYVCDRYELHVRLEGEHQFKVGDEDWSADADFGGKPAQLQLKGPAMSQHFKGGYKLTLRLDGLAPSLQILPFAGKLPATKPVPAVGNAVARSLRFDSRSIADKQPFGAVTAGSEVAFSISALPGVEQLELVVAKRRLEGNQEVLEYLPLARLPMSRATEGKRERWTVRHRFTEPAIYGYHFEARIAGRAYVYGNNRDKVFWTREKGTMGLGLTEDKPADDKRIRRYRQTVYAADFKVPSWARDIVYYYVFPERFRNGDRSNDPQPGRDRYHDKTVELHKNWLDKPWKPASGDGSDALPNNDFFGGDLAGIIDKLDYIKSLGANAIYMTPVFRAASNHKYDTGDYTQIDPAFGTNADFERLCAEAAKRGIRVIPDTSLNHVGQDSPYFNRFGNFKPGGAFDNGKINPDSPYASWFTFDAKQTAPDKQYKGWVGVLDLPEIDKASPAFRAFAYGNPESVMKQWLDRGAAGWRMDVAPWVPDDFWREWRKAVKNHRPDALTVAETWFDASKYFLGDTFDSTMNYIFRNALLEYAAGGDAKALYANIELMREAYPPQAFYALMNLLSTHDQARALHHFGYHNDDDPQKLKEAKQRLKLAVLFQMSFPGSPTIYYGDEVGLAGGDDPLNRAAYPWADEGGKPDEALLADFKRLTAMRNDHAVLRHGSISAPIHLDAHVIALARQDGESWAVTATNNATAARSVRLKLPVELHGKRLRDALSKRTYQVGADGSLTLTLAPLSGAVLISAP